MIYFFPSSEKSEIKVFLSLDEKKEHDRLGSDKNNQVAL